MEIRSTAPYVLGLDIGSTSIGWACLQLRNGHPAGIVAAGVRRFDAGMSGSSIEFQRGEEESNAVARRTARLARRQFRRRATRQWSVFQLLRKAGLLPYDPVNGRPELSAYIEKLDRALRAKYCPDGDHRSAQLLVYRIRSRAAKERVELYELGRAIFHLAKRRGFNSNLRGVPKDDEENGIVKPAIKSLKNDLEQNDLTLGQFLANQNPFEKGTPGKGVRRRWTGREMYLREFETIWAMQAPHWQQLSEELYKKLRRSIFFQRPIRSAKGLVGKCSLEPRRRRLAAAHPLAQEVRMLQFINNVRVRRRGALDRPLNDAEHEQAVAALGKCRSMPIKELRSVLQLPKNAKINFAGDDDEHARGMGTVSDLREILGNRWDALSPVDQEKLFYEVLIFNKRDALVRRAQRHWGFNEQQAQLLADLTLEPGYSSHSRQALEKLLPHLSTKDAALDRWLTYSEAKLVAYPDAHEAEPAYDRLPKVIGNVANLTSPSVIRALTEVRKVVNELLRRFGKPEFIRIELARDLKRSKKERKKVENIIKEQTDKRRKALSKIREEFIGYPEKPGYDRGIEMYLLAEECNWRCPYTNEPIHNIRDLIGGNTRFDIEHIYPRRYLDDSFGNKTLCLHEENRNVKRDRLPAEAYADNPQRYAEILSRVKAFKGPAAAKKLARFMDRDVAIDFSARQLNETRYVSVAAADYLGLLYGGRSDEGGRQRISTLTGGLTAMLRGQWRLNQILGLNDEKNRADHRQHAIDAIVAACTDMGTVTALQTAAAEAWQIGDPRGMPSIDPPWSGLLDDARRAVLSIIVSHRQDRRLNGPLHATTNYTSPVDAHGEKISVKYRKPLERLSEREISGDAIVDETVRLLVQAKYQELKAKSKPSSKPGDVFASPENHPHLATKSGASIPIHSVRVWVKEKPFMIRPGDPTRYVAATPGSNFCTRIVSVLDDQGQEIGWKDELINRRDAMKFRNQLPPNPLERFTLFIHEHVLMPDDGGNWQVYRVLNLSAGDIGVQLHFDGRISQGVKKERIFRGAMSDRRFRKVSVSPTGLLSDALNNEPIDLATLAKPASGKQTARKGKRKGK